MNATKKAAIALATLALGGSALAQSLLTDERPTASEWNKVKTYSVSSGNTYWSVEVFERDSPGDSTYQYVKTCAKLTSGRSGLADVDVSVEDKQYRCADGSTVRRSGEVLQWPYRMNEHGWECTMNDTIQCPGGVVGATLDEPVVIVRPR